MSAKPKVNVQFFALPAALRKYCSTVVLTEISQEAGEKVEDYLFPEWATLRFNKGVHVESENLAGQRLPDTEFPVCGPNSEAIRFRVGDLRQWTIFIHPMGWKRLVGRSAADYANRLCDGFSDEAFAPFRPLARSVFSEQSDTQQELQRITQFLSAWDDTHDYQDDLVFEIFVAMLDPKLSSVGEMAQRAGISRRTLERMCNRHFGFPPKLLLRRQRFMRSLTDFTLDPTLKWIGAIDAAYHDQAQFVRDFRHFMGMSPSEYRKLERPIITTVMKEWDRYARKMVRSLQLGGDRRDYGFGA